MNNEKKLELELQTNTEFHEIVGKVSSEFIRANSESFDKATNFMLKEIGLKLNVDRSYIFKFSVDHESASNSHEWCRPGIEPQIQNLQNIPTSFDRWWASQIFSNSTIHIPFVESMPEEAKNVQALLHSQGIKSTLNVPIFAGDRCWGFIGFDAVDNHRDWSIFQVKYLKIIANIFIEALMRIENEEANRKVQQKLNISSKMASLGILSAGMGHEINNPLAILSGCIDRMERIIQNDGQSALLKTMEKAVSRISSIVNEFQKITAKSKDFQNMVDLSQCLNTVFSNFEQTLTSKKVKLVRQGPSETCFVLGNSEVIKQLLTILISNAVDACNEGQNIKVITEVHNQNILLTIEDSGKGISKENMDHIFDAFYTTKDVGSGTGLGLYIAYNIVTLLSGDIQIESEMGKGTKVLLRLPISRPN